jgi:uncharacterized protein (DUF736 family)
MNTNNNNNNQNDWAKRDIGALWKREGQSQKYLSGYVKIDEMGIEKEVKVVVFANKNKNNNEKAPDYRIYVSKPLENNTTKQTTNVSSQKQTATKKVVTQKVAEVVEEEEDNLL